MDWFRMYSEARNDAKIRSLSDKEHRVWFNLLCFANEQDARGSINGYETELLAVEVADGDVELLKQVLVRLEKLDIISISQDGLSFNGYFNKATLRPPAHEWRVKRTIVFLRDNYTCTYCGARGVKLECDHIIPVSRGGAHELSNLTTACRDCNRKKRAKTPEEWL